MSVCWRSSTRSIALAALAAGALAFGSTDAVAARSKITTTTVTDDSGRVVEHIRISSSGVAITRRGGHDTTLVTDAIGQGPIVVGDGEGTVRFLSDAVVRRGEQLDGDVVAIFGSVRVSGHVTGAAVAVFGSVVIDTTGSVGGDAVAVLGSQHSAGQVSGDEVAVLGSVDLHGTASVGGDAVAVGGRVATADSSRIVGQSVSVSMLPLTLGLPTLPIVIGMIALGWVITLFFGWLFAILFPARLTKVAVTSSRHTFLSIVIAGLSIFLWPLVAILLMATIIGLPIGILLLLVHPLVVYAGQIAATYVLGCKLIRRRLGEGSALAPIAAGSLLIAFFFVAAAVCYSIGGLGAAVALFFGLVGLLVLTGLTTIGTGAFILSRAGSRVRGESAGAAGAAGAPAEGSTAG
jgi:cytoskeletal protein CcmA (bactofilin family)